jgi:kynurenine formamidase
MPQPRDKKWIDLSHTIEDGMITYKGLPAPVICDFWTREYSQQFYTEGTSFQIGKIEMVANTGTYLDSPFHRFAEGKDLSGLPLSSLADLEGIVVHLGDRSRRSFETRDLAGLALQGKAVLFQSGWDRHWRSDQYFEGHPYLTADTAQYLVEHGAALVGIDSLNIDDIVDGRRPVHTTLLRADIPIVEHLCGLDSLPDEGFRFFAVPPMVKGLGTFPVRAFALQG